ncbi:unnamed protein product [Porites evermanni]|uniref:Myb-like domain-containing protein n=1 Tax=Porites evermanni TaxID=104178 RepID=A0ABN8MNS8_9CNID|nr:unnamed protein product [Porites evermanni]
MLKSGDERSLLDTSNDVEQRNKMNGKRMKKKKKGKEEESNQREQDESVMDVTGVNNRNEAINSRAEMVENNVEDPKVKEKQKKEKKKKRKVEERRKMGQDLAISNILDEKEVSNSTAVMAESIEKQKDNEKLREAMAHAEIIHETWTVPTERLKVLKEKGKYRTRIKVKTGKWSLQELRLLQSNMDKFVETYELPDPVRILLRSGTDREDRKFWKRFGRQNEFYKELGRGILRPLNTIYKCATRIYDESNYVGKYSEEEVRELKRLHTVHGADWVTIGQLLGRSRMSVNRKYSKLPTTEGGRGTWTEDEVKCLKEAVYQVTKTAEDQPVPFHGIYWPDVAKIVKTRNIEQCRRKWLENLSWMNDEEEKKWTKQNELRLITRLYNSGITQECDVDWMEVKSDFKSNYPPQWLRKKWLEVKRKAPNYHQMEFEDILDYLYHVYGKTLRAQLEAEASTSSNDAS